MNVPGLVVCTVVLAIAAGCATVPPGPAPEVVRLQGELARLRQDPRVAANAADELRDADAAVADLAADSRRREPAFAHRAYVADRLLQIAEAQGLARFAEARSHDLGIERDRLMLAMRDRQLQDAQARAVAADAPVAAGRRRVQVAQDQTDRGQGARN